MKKTLPILFGILMGLLGAGVLFLVISPPRGKSVILMPPPTPVPITFHVVGGVEKPGVYTLEYGSRVEDAIQAAGGLLPDAWMGSTNLAERLYDGQQILIYIIVPTTLPGDESSQKPGTISETESSIFIQASQLININTASASDLEELPGIGPVTAQKIIEYRESHGLFMTLEELNNVSGIGPATFDRIKEWITIGILP